MMMLADLSYVEPPFHVVLLGTMGLIALMIGSALMRRIVLGMFLGGLGGAVIAWYVLAKGGGDLAGPFRLFGTPVCGLFTAILCACAGFVGKWIRRKPKS
jgi:hypothetical protein